jgi:adenine-specific DNA-methyltransferase
MLHASRSGVIYVKNYNSAGKRVKLRSVLDKPEYLTDRATTEVKAIYGEKIFETPKPIALIRDLIECCCPTEGTILDFFAGTGTTAEAAHELNLRDGGRRRTVLIEQDFPVPKSHIAKTHGYELVSDITRRRLVHLAERSKAFSYR